MIHPEDLTGLHGKLPPEIRSILTVVSEETVQQALQGYTRPLIKSLVRDPKACLATVRLRDCQDRKACPFFVLATCKPCGKMPNCFEPEVDDPTVRSLAKEIIYLWREGVWVIETTKPDHD